MSLSPNADSRPAVYNERNTGLSSSDSGVLSDMQAILESQKIWDQQHNGGQGSDVHQTAINQTNTLPTDTPLRVGRVLLALPYIHCYKVQLSGHQGTCIATATARASHMPLGVKSGDVIAPNSTVLVWKPQSAQLAYIVAVLPTPTMHDDFNASDLIQQGGNSGPKKVEAYRNIPKTATMALGWVPQSCGRPMDGTIGEYVRMSETGIGLLIDSFQTYLRVNEVCGIWFNYFDNFAKLSGLSLNILSYCEHNLQTYDEGELNSVKGYATYPWESTGMYAAAQKFSKTNPVDPVQLDKQFPFAMEDLSDHSQTPVYRLTDHTGYLGQGFNRTLMKPAKDSGKRLMTDSGDPDTGLFQELLALDGGYSVRSAKQITLAKYPLIPNPRRKRAVEDALGDDLTESNDYKFSGKFGSGDEHQVLEWDDSGAGILPNMLRPTGIIDMMARHYNWKSTHPFYYHKKDYDYPEEGESNSPLTQVQFYRGQMEVAYQTTTPVQLKIDDRYKDVNYYNTASFVTLAEDGSVVIADGYGSQILLGGGQIRLEAGGDVMLMSGARVVTLAKEAIIRAKSSVDISSSEEDVRIKAENNLHLLAGNSGRGGMLLESKSPTDMQVYADRIGEEVDCRGITLLSRGGSVNMMAKTMYMRTGVDEGDAESTGDLIIDVANGRSNMLMYAKSHAFFNSEGVGIWHSPLGQDEISMTESHYLGPNFSKIHGPTVMDKDVGIVRGGNLLVDGTILAQGNIIAVKQMGCRKGFMGLGDSSTNNIPEAISKYVAEFTEYSELLTTAGQPWFEGFFPNNIWQEYRPGNTQLLENEIGFSYRDRATYHYAPGQFFLLETRWQQLERTGLLGGGGETWTEKPVPYQGKKLYPWPGKINWVGEPAFLGYSADDQFLLFETTKAKSRKDHQGDYEDPRFKTWKKRVCDGNYSL
jgi:hypothetical protein